MVASLNAASSQTTRFSRLRRAVSRLRRAVGAPLLGACLVGGLALSPACKKQDEAPAGTPAADASKPTGPVARVNGTEIERASFEKQMERTRARFQRAGRDIAPALETRLRENLIRKLVEDMLIAQRAEKEGIKVDAAELDKKVSEHKQRFGSDKAFASFLERTGQSEADVRDDLDKNLLRDSLFAKLLAGQEPTEADAKTYYEENKDKYKQKEKIKAAHILLKTDKTTTDADKKKKADLAKKIYAEAKKPKANFEELAKKYSEGPTAPRGGDLGDFPRGRMVKQFEDVAFAAKPGEVVGPVETQFGFHIIKVYEKTPESQRPFEEVKDSILTSLKARQKSKATRDLLDQLRQQAKIEVLEPGVSLDAKKAPLALDGQPLGGPGAPPGALEMKPAAPGEGAAADAVAEPGEEKPAAAPSTP